MIEFKRDVYQMALTELARFVPRAHFQNRYLRAGMRPLHSREEEDHRVHAEQPQPSTWEPVEPAKPSI